MEDKIDRKATIIALDAVRDAEKKVPIPLNMADVFAEGYRAGLAKADEIIKGI